MWELTVKDENGKVVLFQEYQILASAMVDAEYYEASGYKDIEIRG